MGGGWRVWVVLSGFLLVGVHVGAMKRTNFCRFREPSECCDARNDNCEVEFEPGSYCYCDEECLNGGTDCCPDFVEVCMGIKDDPNTQTKACVVDGVEIPYGESKKVNCNECKCNGLEVECEAAQCMVDDDLVTEINQDTRVFGWRATMYSFFWGWKLRDGLSLRTGTRVSEQVANMYPIKLNPDPSKIPREFDSREAWKDRVTEVRDQGWCGSSWVFSTLGVAQDRLNIFDESNAPVTLSAQNLLSCGNLANENCQWGLIDRAWFYLRNTGDVLEKCFPYESGRYMKIPQCTLDTQTSQGRGCSHTYRYEPAYRISQKVEDIQFEIMSNGPVQAMMEVYQDLFMYETGVYKHTGIGGSVPSTHSVKIVGWGSTSIKGEGVVEYWLVENSWGKDWGEEGYFKIRRGTNECDIETLVLAARPLMTQQYVKG